MNNKPVKRIKVAYETTATGYYNGSSPAQGKSVSLTVVLKSTILNPLIELYLNDKSIGDKKESIIDIVGKSQDGEKLVSLLKENKFKHTDEIDTKVCCDTVQQFDVEGKPGVKTGNLLGNIFFPKNE